MESIKQKLFRPSVFKITHNYPISLPISAEFSKADILAVNGTCYIQQANINQDQLKISAKVIFNILYKDDGAISNYESSADLSYDITDEKIVNASLLNILQRTTDVEVKGERGELEITANVLSSAYFVYSSSFEFIEEIEDAVTKRDKIDCMQYALSSSAVMDIEGEKDFNFFIDRVLCHNSQVKVLNATAGTGEVTVEGEICTEFLLLTPSGERVSETLYTPFRYDVDVEGADLTQTAKAFASVSKATFKITSLEGEKGSSVVGEYSVLLNLALFNQSAVNRLIDGFSLTNEVHFDTNSEQYLTNINNFSAKHKCFGEGDVAFEKEHKIISSLFLESEISDYTVSGGKVDITGFVSCQVVLQTQEGELVAKRARLPFGCTFDCDGEPLYLTCLASGLTVRNLDEKCIMECELYFFGAFAKYSQANFICDMQIGEEKNQDTSAISVVFINKGEDLWSVCKKACATEKVVLADNPDITFPASEDKAIVVYRKIQ